MICRQTAFEALRVSCELFASHPARCPAGGPAVNTPPYPHLALPLPSMPWLDFRTRCLVFASEALVACKQEDAQGEKGEEGLGVLHSPGPTCKLASWQAGTSTGDRVASRREREVNRSVRWRCECEICFRLCLPLFAGLPSAVPLPLAYSSAVRCLEAACSRLNPSKALQ